MQLTDRWNRRGRWGRRRTGRRWCGTTGLRRRPGLTEVRHDAAAATTSWNQRRLSVRRRQNTAESRSVPSRWNRQARRTGRRCCPGPPLATFYGALMTSHAPVSRSELYRLEITSLADPCQRSRPDVRGKLRKSCKWIILFEITLITPLIIK